MIAYFRDRLKEYGKHPLIQNLLAGLVGIDYIVAPIANNRMFQIVDSFIDGEITDVQCRHCLLTTHLGNQYVFRSQAALKKITMLRHCYLSENEKKAFAALRGEDAKVSDDKVKIAKKQYRGQGLYIEDILS